MSYETLSAVFARQHPQAFAGELTSLDLQAVAEVVQSLPVDCITSVLVHLPQPLSDPVLAQQDHQVVSTWLSAGSPGDAFRLLARADPSQRKAWLNGMTDDKTRDVLNRMINFPSRSVGALVEANVTWVSDESRIDAAVETLKNAAAHGDQPVVVLDANGRVQGFLDATQALQLAADSKVKDCLNPVARLRAETALATAIELPAWTHHQWLPVVDRDQRLIGVVSRARLVSMTTAQEPQTADDGGLTDIVSSLADLMPKVIGGLIDLAAGRRNT